MKKIDPLPFHVDDDIPSFTHHLWKKQCELIKAVNSLIPEEQKENLIGVKDVMKAHGYQVEEPKQERLADVMNSNYICRDWSIKDKFEFVATAALNFILNHPEFPISNKSPKTLKEKTTKLLTDKTGELCTEISKEIVSIVREHMLELYASWTKDGWGEPKFENVIKSIE